MDAIVAAVMLTVGIGIHVILWALVLDWLNTRAKDPINWYSLVVGFVVMLLGSFLILTSIIIVVRAVLTSVGAV